MTQYAAYVERLVDLTDPSRDVLLNMSGDEALTRVASGDPQQVREIDGQFAIVKRDGRTVRMARSLGRPLRYFLAKQIDGPCLVVAERMDEIRTFLESEGLGDQFHPSYTRMVPAHYIVQIELIGCPDPNPVYSRFFTPANEKLPTDLDTIGRRYIGALADECQRWLDRIPKQAPIGVLFSGGIDSGAVLLTLYSLLLRRGESPARLKAFTLVTDEHGEDARQAQRFLQTLDLTLLGENVDVAASDLDVAETVRVIEDYKPLDVQAATMTLALCRAIRQRYPDWIYLVDGDGGDENLKDYPIEENSELTIRSVLNNRLLYQEGWGVEAIKHSLVYTGGQSRGHVRSYAPARLFGFLGFSPFALPNVIDVAERIPFIDLTQWDHQRLYELKGEVVARGIRSVTGFDMPIYPKRRFQHGVGEVSRLDSVLARSESELRRIFDRVVA
ncbi:MAG: asparagine synthetase B family protein [Planctomycetales bacterium]|nr:asparagine synthetase B family protein [Planctomycetales bacterium]